MFYNQFNYTALHIAAKNNFTEIVKILLVNSKISINIQNIREFCYFNKIAFQIFYAVNNQIL